MLPPPILELLRRQHGAIAGRQIRCCLDDPAARRLVYRHPDMERLTPRVLRHLASPDVPLQDVMVGVLDAPAGGRLWGKSAATHWGFGRHRLLPPHVAVARDRIRGTRRAQVHVVRHLDDDGLVVHHDIPVARPEVVVLWLAGMWTHRFGHEVALRRSAIELDHAWRQGLVDGRYLHDLVERSGGKGRSGIVVLRDLLVDRPPDYTPAGSRLEERFEELVGPDVARRLRRQVTVDRVQAVRTVDFQVCDRPKLIEINGEAFHTSLTDREADDERYARLLELGYSVLVLWEWDIWHAATDVRRAVDVFVRCDDPGPLLHRPTKAPWQW